MISFDIGWRESARLRGVKLPTLSIRRRYLRFRAALCAIDAYLAQQRGNMIAAANYEVKAREFERRSAR